VAGSGEPREEDTSKVLQQRKSLFAWR